MEAEPTRAAEENMKPTCGVRPRLALAKCVPLALTEPSDGGSYLSCADPVRRVPPDVAQREASGYPPRALQMIASTLRQHERFELDGYRPAYVARRIATRL